MILVTGGTGLVGSHLLLHLAQQGKTIRATYRRQHTIARAKHIFTYYSNKAETLFNSIDWVEANINNIPQLQAVFNGVTHVYHCAAFVSFEPNKYKQLRKINIEGTANVVNLCLSHKVKKLCYVSSIAAIGHKNNPNHLITETTPYNPEADNNVYAISKYGAELEVWRGTQEGLKAVIVNPGLILGAGFWNSGSSGSLFKKIHKGMSHYVTGVTGYVDVLDVVKCMQQLMDSEINSENFIVISENWSFKTFIETTTKALGIKPPKREAKPWLLSIAWRLDWLQHKLLGKRRSLSKQTAKSAVSVTKYDNSKLKNVLNFQFQPIENSIKAIVKLYKEDQSGF